VANCSAPQTNIVPLPDSVALPNYLGGPLSGGLWGGTNERPQFQTQLLRIALEGIEPRAPSGLPDPRGKIVFAGLGYSNGKQLFEKFNLPTGHSQHVVKANLCENGADSSILAKLNSVYWTTQVPAALALLGLDAQQVQIAWMICGERTPAGPFPTNVTALQALIEQACRNAKIMFPNLRILYLDCPAYGGYSIPSSNEPWNFEQGFAVREAMLKQASGDPSMAPNLCGVLDWGLNLWTDGKTMRVYDGLSLSCPKEVQADGHHFSLRGALKFGEYLTGRFEDDPLARRALGMLDADVPGTPPPPTQLP
jgi:hypothetical protein